MNPKLLKLALAVSLTFASSMHVVFAAENKVALVIGNGVYKDKNLNLKNPVNDAKDMKAALEKVGFKVIYMENATFDQMDSVREEFKKSLDSESLTLFYYSGHGVQADGINYLIPSDAKIPSKADLKRRAYDLGYFLEDMGEIPNRANIIILDACRNNPFKTIRTIGNSKGLTAPTETPKGSIIAYATAPNSVASDNPSEKNGMYTKYLKQYLFQPGLTIELALKEVRRAVSKETSQEQTPWENSSLIGDVCLAGCETKTVVKTNYAPLISFVSGTDAVNQNKSYTVKFKGTDQDGDLGKILIDWGDGTAVTEKTAKNNIALSFSHTYQFAGIYDLIATAVDKQNNESETFDKSVEVKEVAVVTPKPEPVITVKIPTLSKITVSSQSVTRGNEITFFATLDSALPSGYVVKINYGNGFESMNGSNTAFDLTVIPTVSAAYKIGIYDSKNILKGKQLTSNFSVSEPAPVVVVPPVVIETPVTKTTGYAKIANNGSTLSDSAKLGTNPTDWACTKDNKTGLIWEVKTDDGGLRDKDWYYSWYEPDANKNGGFEGYKNYYPNGCKGSECDTYAFTNAVNKQGLCDANDWRLPTIDELEGLLTEISAVNQPLNEKLYIDATYFPNTMYWFWSSSPYANSSYVAWYVTTASGYSSGNYKSSNNHVRLVRG
jgi:hypothetical protein